MSKIDWSSLQSHIADASPLLGSLIGGPAGAAVGALIATKFGTANSPDAVLAAIKADPDAALKLRAIDSDERKHLLEMQLQTLIAELADVQNARLMHKDHWMPAALTIGLMFLTTVITWALFEYEIPPSNRDILVYVAGQIITLTATAVAYWIGTSKSSANKDKTIAGLA